MKKVIKINENKLINIIKECVEKQLSEANNYGWVVETEDAQLAYQYFCEELGTEAANEAIVRAMGDRTLSEIMAYLLRMYDLGDWDNSRKLNIAKIIDNTKLKNKINKIKNYERVN